MRSRAAVVVLCCACVLTGCVSAPTTVGPGPAVGGPRPASDHTAATGWRTVSYHGASVDVPDGTAVLMPDPCGGALPAGDEVTVSVAGLMASCPARTGQEPPAPVRPTTVLTVALGESAARPGTQLPSGARVQQVAGTGVTVTVAGPPDEVTALLASARATPTDDVGCASQADPTVALSNAPAPGVLPSTPSSIVVCEYAHTDVDTAPDGADTSPMWLIGSRALSDAETTAVAARLRSAPPASTPDDPHEYDTLVTRLLVHLADGGVRTLQASANFSPLVVTDGSHRVDLEADHAFDPLPSPFDAS